MGTQAPSVQTHVLQTLSLANSAAQQVLTRYHSTLCKNKAYVIAKAVIEFLVTGRHGVYKIRTNILFDRCLLASSKAYFSDRTLTVREPDTDDELEDGVLDPTLNYINPFWKLQLARTPMHVQLACATDEVCSKPFKLVCAFIGRVTNPHGTRAIILG